MKNETINPQNPTDFDPLKGVMVGMKFGQCNFSLPANKKLIERAKQMAKNMPKAEQMMWFHILSSKKTNFKWVKQKVIDNYIVDFYCNELGLVIEIDGDSHAEREEYDKIRTQLLTQFGLEVIRYSNNDVYNSLEGVKNDLVAKIQERQKQIFSLLRGQNP